MERYLRCRTFSEFCTLDESRYFLRAILPVPIEDGDAFCWGVWVEVSRQDHDRYLKAYSADELNELEPIKGCLANELPVYEESLGAPVRLMPSADQRPDVVVLQEGLLATEQQVGMRFSLEMSPAKTRSFNPKRLLFAFELFDYEASPALL